MSSGSAKGESVIRSPHNRCHHSFFFWSGSGRPAVQMPASVRSGAEKVHGKEAVQDHPGCTLRHGLCHLQRVSPEKTGAGDAMHRTGDALRNCTIASCDQIRGRYRHDCPEFPFRRLRQLDKRYRTKNGMTTWRRSGNTASATSSRPSGSDGLARPAGGRSMCAPTVVFGVWEGAGVRGVVHHISLPLR
jgi:hypothetical protein